MEWSCAGDKRTNASTRRYAAYKKEDTERSQKYYTWSLPLLLPPGSSISLASPTGPLLWPHCWEVGDGWCLTVLIAYSGSNNLAASKCLGAFAICNVWGWLSAPEALQNLTVTDLGRQMKHGACVWSMDGMGHGEWGVREVNVYEAWELATGLRNYEKGVQLGAWVMDKGLGIKLILFCLWIKFLYNAMVT